MTIRAVEKAGFYRRTVHLYDYDTSPYPLLTIQTSDGVIADLCINDTLASVPISDLTAALAQATAPIKNTKDTGFFQSISQTIQYLEEDHPLSIIHIDAPPDKKVTMEAFTNKGMRLVIKESVYNAPSIRRSAKITYEDLGKALNLLSK